MASRPVQSEVKPATRAFAANLGVLPPKAGYDLVAADFNDWQWVSFWRANEGPQVRAWLQTLPPGMGLDAGSGTGAYVNDAYDAHHTCTQLDISRQMLAAQHPLKASSGDLSIKVQGDILQIPFRDGAFDWLLCTRVLGHIADMEVVFRRFGRVMKSGGEMFIADVHPAHPYSQTVIRTRDSDICIQTFKHPVRMVLRAIQNTPGFKWFRSRSTDLTTFPGSRLVARLKNSEGTWIHSFSILVGCARFERSRLPTDPLTQLTIAQFLYVSNIVTFPVKKP